MVLARGLEPRPWRPLIPPEQKPQHAGRPTLVLDMNHTLVSSVANPNQKYDFVSKVRDSNAVMLTLKRPFVDVFLKQMAAAYEVIAFTSCQQPMADPVLDKLDPAGEIFAYRLYTESCSFSSEFGHVKDLSMLGRGMERVAIVDDSMSKCVLNLDNWVPIPSFWDDPNDRELLELIPFLLDLAKLDDVRPALRKRVEEWKKLIAED